MPRREDGTVGQAIAGLGFAAMTVTMCAALMTAAVLGHAPVAVLPLLLVTCIAGPMVATTEVIRWAPVLRRTREVSRHRRALDRLPETEHPLGL